MSLSANEFCLEYGPFSIGSDPLPFSQDKEYAHEGSAEFNSASTLALSGLTALFALFFF